MDWQAIGDWLSDPQIQDTLTWLGGGVVVVIGGLWAAFKFFWRSKKPAAPSQTVTADRGGIAAGRDAHVSGHAARPDTERKE